MLNESSKPEVPQPPPPKVSPRKEPLPTFWPKHEPEIYPGEEPLTKPGKEPPSVQPAAPPEIG